MLECVFLLISARLALTLRDVQQSLGYGIQVILLFTRINQVDVPTFEDREAANTLELDG